MQMKSELFVSNINLASFSTYDIGGDARWLAAPKTAEEVLTALEQASASGLLPFLFGMGSNLLFPDQPSKEMLFISLREQVDFHIKENGCMFPPVRRCHFWRCWDCTQGFQISSLLFCCPARWEAEST